MTTEHQAENSPAVVRYDLYTPILADAMFEITEALPSVTVSEVPVATSRNRLVAAKAWSAQAEAGFTERQSHLPEFARAKQLPGLYTVDRMFEVLGRTKHPLLRAEADSLEELRDAQASALKLINS